MILGQFWIYVGVLFDTFSDHVENSKNRTALKREHQHGRLGVSNGTNIDLKSRRKWVVQNEATNHPQIYKKNKPNGANIEPTLHRQVDYFRLFVLDASGNIGEMESGRTRCFSFRLVVGIVF